VFVIIKESINFCDGLDGGKLKAENDPNFIGMELHTDDNIFNEKWNGLEKLKDKVNRFKKN
jgi:hypothetical protein